MSMTPLQLWRAVETAGVLINRGGAYEDGRPWIEFSSTTWLEIGKSGAFELYWSSRDGGPVNVLNNLIDLPRLLPKRMRANHAKEIKPKRNVVVKKEKQVSIKPVKQKVVHVVDCSVYEQLSCRKAITILINACLERRAMNNGKPPPEVVKKWSKVDPQQLDLTKTLHETIMKCDEKKVLARHIDSLIQRRQVLKSSDM
jgi:hypothetical protein